MEDKTERDLLQTFHSNNFNIDLFMSNLKRVCDCKHMVQRKAENVMIESTFPKGILHKNVQSLTELVAH